MEVLNAEIKTRIEMISRGEVPEGYKKTKVGIIPEDWEVKRMGEIAEIGSSKRIMAHEYVPEGIPFYRSKEIIEKSLGNKIEERLYISHERYQEIASQFPIPQEGEILITAVGTLGIPYLIRRRDLPFYFKDGNLIWFREIQDVNKEYLIYLWLSEAIIRQIENTFSGSSQKALTIEKVNKLKFPNAPLPEQQKIAKILSTWDEAIELKEKLIEQKKQQKKGLMQKLLTGEVRLPGFDGEWEEVRLGDIGQTFNGLTGKISKDFGSGKPFITYKNIFENSKVDIKDVGYVKISEDENQNTTKYGDIFFTTSSETPDEVGMSSVLLDTVEELYLNSFCFGFRLNDFKTLMPNYARYLFRSEVFRRDIFKLAQGSTRFNLSKAEVLKLYIKTPPIEEQKAIAQVLSTADKEIELLEKELELLKLQKKGLMQLLLTGIVRVK